MSNAALDVNSKQTITARLNTDGITPVRVKADTNGALRVVNGTVGTAVPDAWAATDDNGRPTMFVVSSADNKTPVALQADSNGNLLIKST